MVSRLLFASAGTDAHARPLSSEGLTVEGFSVAFMTALHGLQARGAKTNTLVFSVAIMTALRGLRARRGLAVEGFSVANMTALRGPRARRASR